MWRTLYTLSDQPHPYTRGTRGRTSCDAPCTHCLINPTPTPGEQEEAQVVTHPVHIVWSTPPLHQENKRNNKLWRTLYTLSDQPHPYARRTRGTTSCDAPCTHCLINPTPTPGELEEQQVVTHPVHIVWSTPPLHQGNKRKNKLWRTLYTLSDQPHPYTRGTRGRTSCDAPCTHCLINPTPRPGEQEEEQVVTHPVHIVWSTPPLHQENKRNNKLWRTLYTLSDQPHPYTRGTRGTTSCDAPCTHCLINPTPTPGEQEEEQVVTHPVHIVWSTPPLHQENKRKHKLWCTLYTLSDQPHPYTRRTRGRTSCDAPCTHCLINPTPTPGELEEQQVVTHPVHIVWSTPPLHQENKRNNKLWRTLYTLSDQPHPYTRGTRGSTSCDAPCTHCLINPTPTPGEQEEQQVVTHPVHIVWSTPPLRQENKRNNKLWRTLYTLSDQPHPYTRRTRGTTSCDAPCKHCLINPTPTPGEQEEEQVVTHPVHIVWSTPPLHQENKRNNKLWRTLYTLSDQPHPYTRGTRGTTSCDAPCTHCLINPTPTPGEQEEEQVVTHPVHIVWSTPPLHQENKRKHKLWCTLYTLSDQPHPYTRRTRGRTSCDAPCTHCLINPTPTPGELEEQQVVTHPVHIVWSTPPLHQENKRNNKLWRTLYTLSDQPHPYTRRTRGSTSCDAPVHIVWSTPPLHQEN